MPPGLRMYVQNLVERSPTREIRAIFCSAHNWGADPTSIDVELEVIDDNRVDWFDLNCLDTEEDMNVRCRKFVDRDRWAGASPIVDILVLYI